MKRLSDTDKWKTPFFKGLPSAYKLLWIYIKDDCDYCGFWHPDFDVAKLRVGVDVEESRAKLLFSSEIQIIPDGRWFIRSFIRDQYNELQSTNAFHLKVMAAIDKFVVRKPGDDALANTEKTESKHTVDSVQCKDINKDKDTNNNKKEPIFIQTEIAISPTFEEFWELYAKKNDRGKCEKAWGNLSQSDKEAIMAYIPAYKESQPDKKFRKDPYTFLYNKSWNNEIISNETAKTINGNRKKQSDSSTADYLKNHYGNKFAEKGGGIQGA